MFEKWCALGMLLATFKHKELPGWIRANAQPGDIVLGGRAGS